MRNREEAKTLYFKIRKDLSKRKKKRFYQFEGQRFFRFGNSWRRLSHGGGKEAILFDDRNDLVISSRR